VLVRPLDGIRILDTSTGPTGGLATMVLADFGADVVKIEPPGGDRFRSMPSSPLWLRGKKSVVLDFHVEADRMRLHDFVRRADVVVVSGPPGRADKWGIGANGAEKLNPSIVHCSITGWGERGPLSQLPGYASVVAARAGRMQAFAGQVKRSGPGYAAVPVAVHAAAHGAVQGVLSALIARTRTGHAQRVTTSLLQALLPYDLVELLTYQLISRGDMTPTPAPEMPTLNYHPVLTKDGTWIQCGNLLEHLFLSFLDSIDLYGELLQDERFLESPALWSADAVEHARDAILHRVREKTADEWMAIFFTNGNVAAEPFAAPAQALEHPDLLANGAIVELLDPMHGRVRMIGATATLTKTPAEITLPAPTVGEHTNDEFAEWTSSRSDAFPGNLQSTRPALNPSQPLAGITIVEFASVIAAPLGTSMLGDLGARVIRVEPIEGDSFRHLLPNGLMTVKTTASKESICLDLKSSEGQAIAKSLIAKADVLVHNYRLGVPERLGIGFESLHTEFPDLVWVCVNGYGPNGPSAHRPATHPVAGASMGGAGYQAGSATSRQCNTLADIRETARQLMRANEPSPDPNTSVIVGSSVLLGLVARERFGIAQAIYIDMLCANAHANFDAFLSYESQVPRPVIDDQHFGTGPCHRLYETERGWIFLALTTEEEWARFCGKLSTDGARNIGIGNDPRFATIASRSTNADALTIALSSLFLAKSAEEWEADLGSAGIACVQADAATPGQFYALSEHMDLNVFVPTVQHERFGKIKRWGPIVTVNGSAEQYLPGVLAGEHTNRLLSELGFTEAAITDLRHRNVVASE
jgi:crotonobetainyl-CoA:carnitine CoA-transferase CaiB-like acyl-CoA transferase